MEGASASFNKKETIFVGVIDGEAAERKIEDDNVLLTNEQALDDLVKNIEGDGNASSEASDLPTTVTGDFENLSPDDIIIVTTKSISPLSFIVSERQTAYVPEGNSIIVEYLDHVEKRKDE